MIHACLGETDCSLGSKRGGEWMGRLRLQSKGSEKMHRRIINLSTYQAHSK
jgi:hypothetical protein